MKYQNNKRPENDSPEWKLYLKLRNRYEAYKALLDLKSEIGRLAESKIKTLLLQDINEATRVREVGPHSKIERSTLQSDEKEAPYKKFLRKNNS